MSVPIINLSVAYPALRSLCELCASAVKIKPQLRFLGIGLMTYSVFLSSCADKPATPPPTEKTDQARLVGRIASIHKNPDFALIQSYGAWNVPTGAILATMGLDGRAANLKVTGEKTGQFAAADIQSGTLEIGDSVYTTLSFQAPPEEESPPETKENEELPGKEEG